MTYKLLSYKEFGKQLLETEDLDPVYIALNKMNMSKKQLARWIVAYSCFYHAGVACRASELKHGFWTYLQEGVATFPRSSERRHFRGNAAYKALTYLSAADPLTIVEFWYKKPDFESIVKRVKSFYLYGDWIAFKLADMCDRVWGQPVDFSNASLGIYKEPLAGAEIIFPGVSIEKVIKTLVKEFSTYKASPYYDRKVNIQEIETILCKYKSHTKGHYEIGKDTREIKEGLKGWGETAKQFSKCLPRIK